MKPSLVILAAGMGSRYGGLKQIDGVGPHDETIIDYSIYDALKAGFGKIIFVIRKDIEAAFKDRFELIRPKDASFHYVFQELDSFTEEKIISERTKPWAQQTPTSCQKCSKRALRCNKCRMIIMVLTPLSWQNGLKQPVPQGIFQMIGYSLLNTLSEYGSVSRGVCAWTAARFGPN